MRAVIQRVLRAAVEVDGAIVGKVDGGLLIYLGVAAADQESDADYLADKIATLRIFEDEQGKMNRSVAEAGGGVLVVSAFTVQADARKGRRPTFENAARGEEARCLYERFAEKIEASGLVVARGVFGAYMKVESVNDGPICVLLDSKKEF